MEALLRQSPSTKTRAVVAASGASEAEKARAMADLPRLQQGYAEAMLPILKQAGSTRAAEWIPGIASFQKWQSEKPRQGSEAEQANEYLKEMNQRGVWSKGTDNVLRSLLAGFADMGTMGAGMAGMVGVPGGPRLTAPCHQGTHITCSEVAKDVLNKKYSPKAGRKYSKNDAWDFEPPPGAKD
jgi:hypothetical protein